MDFGQGIEEFVTEIQMLSDKQHENLITLVGYCDEGKERIVVYEYAEHGSLDRYIRCRDTNYTLTWLERLKIVVDVARGLDHIHNDIGKYHVIIHRDISSSIILLDDKWVAKISNIGLSSVITSFYPSIVIWSDTDALYRDRECLNTIVETKKADVYVRKLTL